MLITIFLFASCDSNISNASLQGENDLPVEAVHSIEDVFKIAQDLENRFNIAEMSTDGPQKLSGKEYIQLKEILLPLKTKGEDFKLQILEQSLHDNNELEYLNNIEDNELIIIGLMSVILENADDCDCNGKVVSGNSLTQNFDANAAWECVKTALGLREIKEIFNIDSLKDAQKLGEIVKAVGKRYLGYLGAAIAVVEFADCMEMF